MFFLMKKVYRAKAKESIVDIASYHNKDQNRIPDNYTKLRLVNKLIKPCINDICIFIQILELSMIYI